MIKIDYIGYSAVHSADFGYEIKEGFDCYLLLLITSSAEVLVEGEMLHVPENSAILYTPGHPICYCAAEENYRNDWIRFYSDESFVEQFPIKNVPFSVADPEYCHNLFKLLTWENSFSSESSETVISHLMWVLFSKLYDNSTDSFASMHTHALIRLRKKITNHPQLSWSVEQMAEDLHLSTSRLQTLYKQLFDCTCMEDVIAGRIRLAKDQLRFTTKPIQELSEYCGYNNVEHFCRQFKKQVGCTPGQYRKACGERTSP